jgi:outer membrane protein OmpA-like peptidoglycan-associated protein
MGVSPSRVEIVAHGDKNPIVATSNQDTNVLSRRVTASVAGGNKAVIQQWTIYTVRKN